jgi:DNA-binding transcriptional regulator YdaS (Cro superfamily)
MNNTAKTAIREFGQADLARAIGADPAQVHHWLNDLRPVPAIHCPAIERALSGKATRKDLRPDDWQKFWPELEAV